MRPTVSALIRIGLGVAALAFAPTIHAQSSGDATSPSAGNVAATDKVAAQPKKSVEENQHSKESVGLSPAPAVSPDPLSGTSNSDAAAKAERRRNFEEAKRRLEQGDGSTPQQAFEGFPNPDLVLYPIQTGVLIGQERKFDLYYRGNKVLEKTQWRTSDPSIAVLTGGAGTVIGKAEGTATITAQVGSWYAEAKLSVYAGNQLPAGTAIWTLPLPGGNGKGPVQIVPAVPSAGGH